MWKDTSQKGKKETISAAPHSHEGHNSAESKTTQWNRKSVFLGIHLHSNYSDILGSACTTGVTQCTVAKKNIWDTYQGYDTKDQTINMQKGKDRKKSNQPKKRKNECLLSWQHFTPTSCVFSLSLSLSLPPALRHQVKLQTWGEGMREVMW